MLFLQALLSNKVIANNIDPVKKNNSKECVILLHGLARSSRSMSKIAEKLSLEKYITINHDYPSTKFAISELAEKEIPIALKKCALKKAQKIHFVAYSMGGILVRYYLQENEIKNLGRVVMLGSPNQGSEVVDKLSNVPGFEAINGPAGNELGTDSESVPNKLGPANFELGVIAGNSSVNLILSQLIPGEDDGKVSVERTKLEGMKDFLVMPHSHPFIMKSDEVIDQVIYFLRNGKFSQK